jgi:hypothetical protein
LSDLIAEATAGKRRELFYNKVGTAGVIAATNTLWLVGNQPAAGAIGSAAPGGRACDNTTTGAMTVLDAVSADTRHVVSGWAQANFINSLLIYDRLFDVAIALASIGTAMSVTGVPTRYQSSTATAADYAGGNFAFIETVSALPSTAHNWTVCQYRNQAGTDAQSFPSIAGLASCIANRLDVTPSTWFFPLASGDSGVMDLAQIQASVNIASGTADAVIGHPLAMNPIPIANIACQMDGINTAFNLVRVFDGACLALLEVAKPATNATTYSGAVTLVHG